MVRRQPACTSGGTHPPTEGNDAADDEDAPPPPPLPHPTIDEPLAEIKMIRNGKQVRYNGEVLGTITLWARGISTKCMIHGAARCRIAIKLHQCETDRILVEWLLACKSRAGATRLNLEEHLAAEPYLDP